MRLPTKGELAALAVRDECLRRGWPLPETEHPVIEGRRFRFDLAWGGHMLAAEFDGGSWVGGRHTRPAGFEADCEKLSLAAVGGWRVLRCTYRQFHRGDLFRWLESIFGR